MIEFEENDYKIDEEVPFITVCLSVIDNVLQRNVSLAVITVENSATGLNY